MTVWAEGDALSPSNLNNNTASATSVTGFSTNTLSAEVGSTVSALGNLVSASTFSAGAAVVVPIGTAVAPAVRFDSEQSLGLYRSAASTLALSYGTLNLATGAANLSVRTVASFDSTTIPVDAILFAVNATSGASLGINSGGTVYWFDSSASTLG